MRTVPKPMVGQWYRHLDKGQDFQVVAVDLEDDYIEMQHFDGDVEEMTMADWAEQDIKTTAAPEDWTGPMDDIERDDLGYSDPGRSPSEWMSRGEENHAPFNSGEAPDDIDDVAVTDVDDLDNVA